MPRQWTDEDEAVYRDLAARRRARRWQTRRQRLAQLLIDAFTWWPFVVRIERRR